MKNLMKGFLAVAIIVTAFTSCGSTKTIAVEEGWDLLGEKTVNFVIDNDKIDVYNQTLYTAVKFQVLNKDVVIKDVNVIYPNGDKLNPSTEQTIAAGSYSKEIELDPLGKEIRSVQFKYRSTGSILKSRARVLVFGKRAYVQPR